MDDLNKEFIKENKNVDNEEKEIAKACKIVAEANEEGGIDTLEIKGNALALLSMICTILVNMEKYGNDSAEDMAMIILTALKNGGGKKWMTSEEIIKEYIDSIYIIDTQGFVKFKELIEEQKNNLSVSQLTIASSIIAVFDLIEKKGKN